MPFFFSLLTTMSHKNVVRLVSNGFEMYHKSEKKTNKKPFQETGLLLMLLWYFWQTSYEKELTMNF